ncbi:MAG: hypothetical protein ABIH66_01570 [bacterium]
MRDPRKKILDFITTSNVFEVMGHFKRLGLLTGDDIRRAAKLSRADWIQMMKEKAGAAKYMPECDHNNDEETE